MSLVISNISEVSAIARHILSLNKYIICLSGEIGAGKTTLAKALIKIFFQNCGYNIIDEVTSPTFNILQIYDIRNCHSSVFNDKHTKLCPKVWHFDLYRIKDIDEAEELGIYEALDSHDLVIIEWPELMLGYFDGNIMIRERSLSIKITNQGFSNQYIYEILRYENG